MKNRLIQLEKGGKGKSADLSEMSALEGDKDEIK